MLRSDYQSADRADYVGRVGNPPHSYLLCMETTINRRDHRAAHVANAGLKAKALAAAADNGWLEGYAAVYGNTDAQGEIILPGAFARSIGQVIPAGKIPLMIKHQAAGGDVTETIGLVTEAREDDHGLWIHAEFSAVKNAQDTRQKVLEGSITGLSVGFRDIRATIEPMMVGGVEKPAIMHRECALVEVTVTNRPANLQAEITGAKSADSIEPLNEKAIPDAASQGTAVLAPVGTAQGKSAPANTAATPPASHAIARDLAHRERRLELLLKQRRA